jgi:hypothetical protein
MKRPFPRAFFYELFNLKMNALALVLLLVAIAYLYPPL